MFYHCERPFVLTWFAMIETSRLEKFECVVAGQSLARFFFNFILTNSAACFYVAATQLACEKLYTSRKSREMWERKERNFNVTHWEILSETVQKLCRMLAVASCFLYFLAAELLSIHLSDLAKSVHFAACVSKKTVGNHLIYSLLYPSGCIGLIISFDRSRRGFK